MNSERVHCPHPCRTGQLMARSAQSCPLDLPVLGTLLEEAAGRATTAQLVPATSRTCRGVRSADRRCDPHELLDVDWRMPGTLSPGAFGPLAPSMIARETGDG